MNDRFKFRVWDKKDKEYLDPDYYEGFYLMPDGKVHVGMTVENGLYDEYRVIPPQQLIVEQCTGQQDKNGNLIFEGDILKTGIITPPLPVSFVDGAFVYTYGNMGNYQLRQEVLVDCEIVGTIHDPEYKDHFREVTKMMEVE